MTDHVPRSGQPALYIGLMSGTSMDGIDAALVELRPDLRPQLRLAITRPLPGSLTETLHDLAAGMPVSLDRLLRTDAALGEELARAVHDVLEAAALDRRAITAVGSHGQTVQHSPDGPHASSLQIGDANIIAERTGITTVADFRRRDMAAGGQGAPLVSGFHHCLLASASEDRAVLNLGGIGNVSLLPRGAGATWLGFDTGPANTLLDAWARRHLGRPRDDGGRWADSGTVNEGLLRRMLAEPFFSRPPPRSTGRELFNEAWLERCVRESGSNAAPADVQRTLVQLGAEAVAGALDQCGFRPQRLLVCGGGVHNARLMRTLAELLPCPVESVAEHGVAPDFLEAMAFAWFAHCRLQGVAASAPSLTGARHEVVLGALYPGR